MIVNILKYQLLFQGSEPSWAWGSTQDVKMKKRSLVDDYNEDSQVRGNILMSWNEANMHVRMNKHQLNSCVGKSSKKTAHDANVWIKNPGESDGRFECFIFIFELY